MRSVVFRSLQIDGRSLAIVHSPAKTRRARLAPTQFVDGISLDALGYFDR